MWTEKSRRLSPTSAKAMFRQIATYGKPLQGSAHIEFVQFGTGVLKLSLDSMDSECTRNVESGSEGNWHLCPDDLAQKARLISRGLVVEVNLVYLLKAVVSRVAYFERADAVISPDLESLVGLALTQERPDAKLKYVFRTFEVSPDDGESDDEGGVYSENWKIISGPRSQKVQESITDIFHSRVRQDASTRSSLLEEVTALLRSDEAERMTQSIGSMLAADGIGVIHRDDVEKGT